MINSLKISQMLWINFLNVSEVADPLD